MKKMIFAVLAVMFMASPMANAQDVKVDKMPTFQNGGLLDFAKWAMSNVKYPEEAINQDIIGKVLVEFGVHPLAPMNEMTVSCIRGVHQLPCELIVCASHILQSPLTYPAGCRQQPQPCSSLHPSPGLSCHTAYLWLLL